MRKLIDRLLVLFDFISLPYKASVYLLDNFGSAFTIFGSRLGGTLGYTALRCDPDAEEFIKVVGIYSKERKTFKQRHMLACRFLQYSAVEKHPTDISFQVRRSFWFLCHDSDCFILIYKVN